MLTCLVTLLTACQDRASEIDPVALPVFRLPHIHTNESVVLADSLFLLGNLPEASAGYTEALDDINARSYALARLAEIDYYHTILYGKSQTSTKAFESFKHDSVLEQHDFFAWVARFYKGAGFDVDSFLMYWRDMRLDLEKSHYWAVKGHMILGEYYKHYHFNRDSANYHFTKFIIENSEFAERKFYDFYWCYERLIDIATYYRDHLYSVSYANILLHTDGWRSRFDSLHLANAHAARGYIMYRFEEYEESMRNNVEALGLLEHYKHTPLFQEALKSCLVTCIHWPMKTDFMLYAELLSKNITQTGKDHVNYHWLIGMFAYQNQEYKESIPHFALALEHAQAETPINIPRLQAISTYYSEALEHTGDFHHAVSIYRIADIYDYQEEWSFEDLITPADDDEFYYISYARYASIYLQWAIATSDPYKLRLAENLAIKAEQMLSQKRYTDEETALVLFDGYTEIFHLLAQIQFEKYRTFDDTSAVAQYFKWIEIQRGNLMWRDLRANLDTSHALLIQKDQQWRTQLKHLKREDASMHLNTTLDSMRNLQLRITETMPEYGRIIQEVPELETLQLGLALDTAALLSLTVFDQEVVILTVSQDCIELNHSPWNAEYDHKLRALKSIIRENTDTPSVEYAHLAYDIYSWLQLDRNIAGSTRKWLVMIDENFSGFNLESLCTSVESDESYGDLNYLLYRHQIVNVQSMKLYLSYLNDRKVHELQDVALLSWTDRHTLNSHEQNQLLPELPGTLREKEIVLERWEDALVYSGKECTKENFIRAYTSKDLDLIHLALHAKGDTSRRDVIHMYFRDGLAGIDTFAGYALFPLRSHVKTVILSGCEGAVGKVQKGDGKFNFPRYFLLNGASNVVAPLWLQNDLASSQIFRHFYRGSLEDISRSLQEAKIQYLSSSIPDLRKHPHYWSGLGLYQ